MRFTMLPTLLVLCSIYLASGQNVSQNDSFSYDAGIYLQVSQSGLTYVDKLAQQAVPEMIKNTTIPDTENSGFKVADFSIDEFSTPNISSVFVPGVGIESELLLPHALITAKFETAVAFWTKKGRFKARVTNLLLKMVISFDRDERGQPIITIPVCNGTTEEFVVVFGGDFSVVLNAVRGLVQSYIQEELDTILCDLTMKTAQMLSDVKEESAIPSPELLNDDSSEPEPTQQTKFNPALLCETNPGRKGEEEDSDAKKTFSGYSMNFDLVNDPIFTPNHSLLGFEGGLLYRNLTAGGVEKPQVLSLPWGQQMATFVVSQYVPNTFFRHVAYTEMGRVSTSVGVDDLPGVIRSAMTLICWGCELRLLARLTEPPQMSVKPDKGVMLLVRGNTRLIFEGSYRQSDIINADVQLIINVKPYVRYGRLYGKIKLEDVEIDVKETGVGGFVGNAIENMYKSFIPKQIWPQIKRRLRYPISQLGIKLPVVCGIELVNTKLHYLQNAIIVDTDFDYNLEYFLKRFHAINAEMENRAGLD